MPNDDKSPHAATPPSSEAAPDTLGGLCQAVLPVWSGQIDMARSQVEDAAVNLVGYFVGIASRIDNIGATVSAAEQAVAALQQMPSAEDAGAAERAQAVATLQQGLETLSAERDAISQAVKRGVIALQFQDRISQVLSSVRRDLEKLRERVDEHGHLPEAFDVGGWLDELLRTYSMKEQVEVHMGDTPASNVDIGDITLF
jgi:cell pole-organizing protein PopZ